MASDKKYTYTYNIYIYYLYDNHNFISLRARTVRSGRRAEVEEAARYIIRHTIYIYIYIHVIHNDSSIISRCFPRGRKTHVLTILYT